MDTTVLWISLAMWPASGCAMLLLGLLAHRMASAGLRPMLNHVGPKPWTLWQVAYLALLMFALMVAASGSVMIAEQFGWQRQQTEVTMSALFETVGLAVVLFLFHRWRLPLAESFGLKGVRPLAALGLGLCVLLAVLPWILLLGVMAENALRSLGLPVEPQEAVKVFSRGQGVVALVVFGVLAMVIAPVFEESVFRGFLYPAIKQKLGAIPAAMLVSVLFAMIHHNLAALAPITLLGVALVMAYEATGSLLVPIFLHSGFNAVAFLRLLAQTHPV